MDLTNIPVECMNELYLDISENYAIKKQQYEEMNEKLEKQLLSEILTAMGVIDSYRNKIERNKKMIEECTANIEYNKERE